MIKSKAALTAMTKTNVIEYAVALGKNFESLHEQLFDPEKGVIAKLQSQLEISSHINSLLSDRLQRLEKNQNLNSQYLRKETIEIHKFPKDFPDKKIEAKVLEMLNEVKEEEEAPFTAADFHACHRLAKKDRVIVKLTHRKRMRAVIKSRSKLSNKDTQTKLQIGRVYIVESMAGPYKRLLFKCQQLKSAGSIHDCWFFNGNINVVLEEKGDRHHIAHSNDILDLLDMTDEVLEEIVKTKF